MGSQPKAGEGGARGPSVSVSKLWYSLTPGPTMPQTHECAHTEKDHIDTVVGGSALHHLAHGCSPQAQTRSSRSSSHAALRCEYERGQDIVRPTSRKPTTSITCAYQSSPHSSRDVNATNANLEHGFVVQSPSKKYARQKRHKTRTDKYDFKRDVTNKWKTSQVKVRPKRVRNKRIKTGLVLEDEFEAPNIEPDRLTLQRPTQRGLFSKLRSSMIYDHHDLPDLTFCTMEYLSRQRRSLREAKQLKNTSSGAGPTKQPLQDSSDHSSPDEELGKHNKRNSILFQPLVSPPAHRSWSSSATCSDLPPGMQNSALLTAAQRDVTKSSFESVTVEGGRAPLDNRSASSSPRTEISWSSSPERFLPIKLVPSIPQAQKCRQVASSGTGSAAPRMVASPVTYTRRALIGSQPGIWRRPRSAISMESIESVTDLRALAQRLDDENRMTRGFCATCRGDTQKNSNNESVHEGVYCTDLVNSSETLPIQWQSHAYTVLKSNPNHHDQGQSSYVGTRVSAQTPRVMLGLDADIPRSKSIASMIHECHENCDVHLTPIQTTAYVASFPQSAATYTMCNHQSSNLVWSGNALDNRDVRYLEIPCAFPVSLENVSGQESVLYNHKILEFPRVSEPQNPVFGNQLTVVNQTKTKANAPESQP